MYMDKVRAILAVCTWRVCAAVKIYDERLSIFMTGYVILYVFIHYYSCETCWWMLKTILLLEEKRQQPHMHTTNQFFR